MSGLFVVFEGGDGVGKSHHVRWLGDWLTERGVEVVRTFEPGDTGLGRRIREIVLSPDTGDLAPRAEALLFAADKAQHVHEVILPALRRGAVVITDRYVDSTLAYQGAGRALSLDEVEHVNRWATEGLLPDLTVVLDLDPDRGVGALEERDRMEDAGTDFHVRVREGFLALAARDAERYLVLEARDDREANRVRVRERVGVLLGLSEASGSMEA